jgi:hypothetical protein
VVGLKLVEVKEAPEEVRRWEAKSALKMSGEDHVLARLRLGLALLAGNAAPNLLRYPPGAVEPNNFGLGHIGAHPSPAAVGIQIYAGTLARAAGFSLVTGSSS